MRPTTIIVRSREEVGKKSSSSFPREDATSFLGLISSPLHPGDTRVRTKPASLLIHECLRAYGELNVFPHSVVVAQTGFRRVATR